MAELYALWAVVATFVYGYVLLSGRLKSTPFGGALFFVLCGIALGPSGLNWLRLAVTSGRLETIAEFTLALVLFSDAAGANLRVLRRSTRLPIRLLGIGLPLTILVGGLCAALLFPSFSLSEAAILGIVLAPTDAALGQPVVTNPRVPDRIREDLSVESGLNDGICVPFLLSFLAMATASSTTGISEGLNTFAVMFVQQIGISTLVGGGLALAGVGLRDGAARAGWIADDWRPLLAVALPIVALCLAQLCGGSGFIACFVAGLVFGGFTPREGGRDFVTVEAGGDLLSLITWLTFGAYAIAIAITELSPASIGYAVLSLTVVRMVPVALAMAGLGLDRATIAFVGWFGPRGLASIVFAVMVLDGNLPHGHRIVSTVLVTVLLSVVLHGLSAPGLVRLYARQEESQR